MSNRGRKPKHEPALAYEYRRYITLVQVLAMDSSNDDGIRTLCKEWNVTPVEDRSVIPADGIWSLDEGATIRALAQHAMAYHRVRSKE